MKSQGHPDFEALSRKAAQLGPMLLLNINRKPYMKNPIALSHLTLKGQSQGYPDFEALYLVKEPSKFVTIKY